MKNRHEGLAEMKKDGVTYCNMFWLFMFGNVLGVLLEGTWCRLIFGHWETHVATIWGPFSLIYGVGAVMFYISGEKYEHRLQGSCRSILLYRDSRHGL